MDFQPLDRRFSFQGVEAIDTDVLETFEYQYPSRRITVEITTTEFTAVCPYSGLPDFGTLRLSYIPDKRCVELRSLKYYLHSFRQVGIFYEHLVNRVLEDLVRICDPFEMTVIAEYNVRGGLATRAVSTWKRDENNQKAEG